MQDSKYCYLTGVISIHALLWSATFIDSCSKATTTNFYPRTPVECDGIGQTA